MEGVISNTVRSLSPVTFGISLAVLILSIVYFAFRHTDLPPGPSGIPFFGYWPFLTDENCHLKLHALKERYGDVFSFKSSGRLFINLGSIKAVREALVTKAEYFGDRTKDYHLASLVIREGLIFINGETWKVMRKLFLLLMKERVSNSIKTDVAGSLYDSIQGTIKELKAKEGEPVNLIEFLTHKCRTVFRLTLFGSVGVTEDQIRKLVDLYTVQLEKILPMTEFLYGNFAKYFVYPFMPRYKEVLKCREGMEKIIYGIIEEHKATYDPENPRDIIDEYFKERDRRQSKGDSTAKLFTDKFLMSTLIQFVGDGCLLVGYIIALAVKNLLDHPEEQDKIYKELMEVVGPDRHPVVEDKSKLTYFNAFFLETMRTEEFFNFFLSQECTKETTLGGYKIPKRAILLVNFYSSHHDPDEFEDSDTFNPSRYIQTEGKKKPEMPISFGIGKRSCVGEGFVMMEVFLVLTTLIQNFQLSLLDDSKPMTLEYFFSGKMCISIKPRH